MATFKVGDVVDATPSDYDHPMVISSAKIIAHNPRTKMYLVSSPKLPKGGYWILGTSETIDGIKHMSSVSLIKDFDSYDGGKCWWVEECLMTLVEVESTTTPISVRKGGNGGNGCSCKICQEYYPYADANQSDGSLICYSCKIYM